MVQYKLIRKSIKNINLRITKTGEIVVSAPYFCPQFLIDNFVMSKESWIQRKRKNIVCCQNQYSNDQRILFKQKVQDLITKWEQQTGLYCSSFRIKNMKTRWGSCNPKTGNINLNIQLLDKPEICLEYVILHELMHLKVPNHSKDFYDLVMKYMPNYKEIKKILNTENNI